MWLKRKKHNKYRIHYLNTIIGCVGEDGIIQMSVSDVEYKSADGREINIVMLTNGKDTYFDLSSVTELFGLNFRLLDDNIKIIRYKTLNNYIHCDSITTVAYSNNGSGKYNSRIRLISGLSFNNRVNRNNIIECIVRRLKIISNLGEFSSWKKLK